MDHAVDLVLETDKEAELGDRLDLALDQAAHRMRGGEGLPRIVHALLQTERYAALVGVDFKNLNFDLLSGLHDLGRRHVLLDPGHLRYMHEAFDAGLEFDESTIVRDVCDLALESDARRILGADA